MSYLQTRMRWLLAQASLMAEASAQSLESERTTHSKPGDVIPHIAGRSTFDEFAKSFANARTMEQQERAVRAAERELRALQGHDRPKPIPDRVRILMFEGIDDKTVAVTLSTSTKQIHRWRRQLGKEPRYGRKAA